ncbi:unnamed protein product [Lota lota]
MGKCSLGARRESPKSRRRSGDEMTRTPRVREAAGSPIDSCYLTVNLCPPDQGRDSPLLAPPPPPPDKETFLTFRLAREDRRQPSVFLPLLLFILVFSSSAPSSGVGFR